MDLIVGNLTDAQKLKAGNVQDQNFTAVKLSDFVYSFSYTLDDSFKVSLAPTFVITKI